MMPPAPRRLLKAPQSLEDTLERPEIGQHDDGRRERGRRRHPRVPARWSDQVTQSGESATGAASFIGLRHRGANRLP